MNLITEFGSYAIFSFPANVAIDRDGSVHVVDYYRHIVSVFTSSFLTVSAEAEVRVNNFRYVYGGILPPIKSDGSSVFKLGSTIPVKFQLTDCSGAYVTNAIATLYLSKISNQVSGGEAEAVSTSMASTGNQFRYDTAENQYVFNLPRYCIISAQTGKGDRSLVGQIAFARFCNWWVQTPKTSQSGHGEFASNSMMAIHIMPPFHLNNPYAP